MKKIKLWFPRLLLLAMVFSFVPLHSQALTYNEILQGKVLGDSTIYPYPSSSLVNDGGTIYFIQGTIKVPFTNWSAFIGLGYSSKNIINGSLQNYTLSTYAITTSKAQHPWGSWLSYNNTIYYSTQDGLIGVPDSNTFLSNGGNWKYVVNANSYDITALKNNPNLPVLAANDPRIYSQNSTFPNSTTLAPIQQTVVVNPTSNSVATISPVTSNQVTSNLQKQTLVFQIDQGFGNGIIQNQDSVGLQRMITGIQAFQSKYEVYVTLSSRQADKTKLDWALDILKQNNIPFILEVYASDGLSTGVDSVNNPYDVLHGREMSVTQLQQYKTKYGSMFAGVRMAEVFAQNFTILACQQLGANWCDSFNKQGLPNDRFYQKAFLEDYIKFAHDNGMFALFTDFYWSAYHPWTFDQTVVKQPQNEQDLQSLVNAYPNTVVVAFANNEPNEGSANKINSWQTVVQPYVQYGAKGFGLSDQSWVCAYDTSCSGTTIANWASTAFNSGALVVETEPYWFWWNFPRGVIGAQTTSYTNDSQWANRGYANSNLQALATQLGVTLPSSSMLPIATLTNDAMCVSVNAPDSVKPGESFTATVTIKNTGTKTWISQNSSVSWDIYRLGSYDMQQAPYNFSKWGTTDYGLQDKNTVIPGDQTTFTINAKAPTTENTYDFTWQMFEHGVEWFGSTCGKKIDVRQPIIDFTITPLVTCLAQPSTANAFTVQVPYVLPNNSWVNIDTDNNDSNGYYNHNASGVAVVNAPYDFYPYGLTIDPGKTYYVSVYDGAKQYLSPKKTITIPGCTSAVVPPPTNPTAVCAAPGNSTTISWSAPTGYSTFFLRVKLYPNPADGSAIAWNDSYASTSYTFNTTPGLQYNWWVQTKDPNTGSPSTAAVGSTFTCPTP